MVHGNHDNGMKPTFKRTQTGVRIEVSTLKVLKGLAEYLDMSVGDLIEGMAWHNFEGKAPFCGETLEKIDQLRSVYGLSYAAADSHKMADPDKGS